MSYPFSLLLAGLAGWSFTALVPAARSSVERVGLSVLLGMGWVTLVMFATGLVGLPIRPELYLSVAGLGSLDGLRRAWTHRAHAGLQIGGKLFVPRHLIFIAPVIVVTAALLGVIIFRCVYLPNRFYDSITSFDLLGRAIATERVFRVSLFAHTELAAGGGSYPPFTALLFAWGYQTGLPTANTAMIAPLLAFLIWLLGFARRFVGATSAWALVGLCLLSPDFYGYMHLPLTNAGVAIFASLGLLSLAAGLRERRQADIAVSMIAMALLVWCRADGGVFLIGGTFALWVFGRASIARVRRLLYPVPALAVLLLWQIYSSSALDATAAERLTPRLFLDLDRLGLLVMGTVGLLLDPALMGFPTWALLVAIGTVVAARAAPRSPDGVRPLVLAIVVSLAAYVAFFYQVDPVRQAPLESLLQSPFRRGVIAFVPAMWMAFLLSPVGVWLRRAGATWFSWRDEASTSPAPEARGGVAYWRPLEDA